MMDIMLNELGFMSLETEKFTNLVCKCLSWDPSERPSTLSYHISDIFESLYNFGIICQITKTSEPKTLNFAEFALIPSKLSDGKWSSCKTQLVSSDLFPTLH